ncbi:SMP-30/gluconolactonase/LRE family protein [Agrobacterium sp. O3.4]|nr:MULTISPECIES: SMP-30/gluconolactonase/LRE family protein [Rhizobium/Agrobacterium group]MCZ7469204.1 SMP-30/gluconolactonase/LRE family protein [Rhizobium rhizogenes]
MAKMMLNMERAELVCDVIGTLSESPVWDERRQTLFWCDIMEKKLHSIVPSSGKHWTRALPDTVSCLGLCESGKLIVACGMQILLVDPENDTIETLATIPAPDDLPCRLNDGRVGPDGAFWLGTMDAGAFNDIRPMGQLWRATATDIRCTETGLTCPNGLAFSADGTVMWHSDSVQRWIRRRHFDRRTGLFDEGRIIARPTKEDGRPDGGCVDGDGRYWSAGVSAGVLNIHGDDGTLLEKIPMPVPHPTMSCFGGPDFRTLFVTSHRNNMDEETRTRFPRSGGVWAIPANVEGFPAFRFADGA